METWQKCPVCSGSGQVYNHHSSSAYAICNVCNGHGIINTLTGYPPAGQRSFGYTSNGSEWIINTPTWSAQDESIRVDIDSIIDKAISESKHP